MTLKEKRKELIKELRKTDNPKEQDEIKNQIDLIEQEMACG